MPHFASWDSFGKFRHEVSRQRRYLRTQAAEQFLTAVAATCKSRLRPLLKETRLWRAQLGNDWQVREDKGGIEEAIAYPPSRMKPLRESASEGRVNPKGIPYLYLSTSKEAAMSEIRPWIGATVSLALFEITRPLTVVDCGVLQGQFLNLAFLDRVIDEKIPDDKVDDIVWAAIDTAFSEPVTNTDDVADYAATQILAELFRHEGHDGVVYRSAFGEKAYNIALFDIDSATQLNGSLYDTTSVDFRFSESGNPYFITRKSISGASSNDPRPSDQ